MLADPVGQRCERRGIIATCLGAERLSTRLTVPTAARGSSSGLFANPGVETLAQSTDILNPEFGANLQLHGEVFRCSRELRYRLS